MNYTTKYTRAPQTHSIVYANIGCRHVIIKNMSAEFYHVLNRGVDKRDIFLNKNDYFRFIHNLFVFNDQKNSNHNNYWFSNQSADIGCRQNWQDLHTRELLVNIHFFCLMPNHYHLLLSPLVENGIPLFMKKLNMGYAKYFNERNNRIGALFQGKYKSILIKEDAHFLYLPYYIHFNPFDLKMPEWREGKILNINKALEYLESYRWSSHLDYTGIKNFPSVTQRKFFLELFEEEGGYAKSIRQFLNEMNIDDMGNILLE